jgi:hypothetical protein
MRYAPLGARAQVRDGGETRIEVHGPLFEPCAADLKGPLFAPDVADMSSLFGAIAAGTLCEHLFIFEHAQVTFPA